MYDAAGNKTALVDPVGNRTSFVYDALNRLVEQDDPLNAKTTFGYDATSQLTNAGATNYSYDLAGNCNSTGYATGAAKPSLSGVAGRAHGPVARYNTRPAGLKRQRKRDSHARGRSG